MKKYVIGDIVKNVVELKDENGNTIPVNTPLRIVAIAAKVRMSRIKDEYHDKLEDFFNAVLASQENDYESRIRANFCTIRK
jgi:hypothetical protein